VVLRERVGVQAAITGVEFGEQVTMGEVRVSLHPAGHILGSAQVRVERGGEVWVVSGDYKTAQDRTCEAFEPVSCRVFITESTFGLPIYRWRAQAEVFGEINEWWRSNQREARTSVVFAYALGKAQRVLGGVDASIGPIVVHGAVGRLNRAYAEAGVELPRAELATETQEEVRGRGLVIAPPSAAGSPWLRRFMRGPATGGISTALVSGWMQVRGTRRRQAVDRGFVLSDHADWDGLLETIRATGAERIGVTHGYVRPLARYVEEVRGLGSFIVPTRYEGERVENEREGDEEVIAPDAAAPEGGEGGKA
jgi:putative mRNA 3-end processing factor